MDGRKGHVADTTDTEPAAKPVTGAGCEISGSAPQTQFVAGASAVQTSPAAGEDDVDTCICKDSRATSVGASGSSARWWLAVVAGSIVSLPMAWILSYAAALPFFLGVFFFALLGLVIGSIVHRFAAPARPYGRFTLVVGTTVVVAVGWLASIAVEARGFPKDMAVVAGGRTLSLGGLTIEEYRASVDADVRRYLAERYPPGGTLGYVRWILTNGTLRRGDIAGVNRTLSRTQTRWAWAIRVVLSVALLGFGIASQTLLLSQPVDPHLRRRGNGTGSDDG